MHFSSILFTLSALAVGSSAVHLPRVTPAAKRDDGDNALCSLVPFCVTTLTSTDVQTATVTGTTPTSTVTDLVTVVSTTTSTVATCAPSGGSKRSLW